jgi:hypothetical protein
MANEDCLSIGDIIPGCPPLYLATYVDDIIYFSADLLLEKQVKADFLARVKIDFMGEADYYLGTHFDWKRNPNGHITCHLSHEGYAHILVDAMGLQNAVSSMKMTPYHSGLAINTLSNHDSSLSNTQRKTLRHKYRSYLGMLNWLSVSTQPDLTTVRSLLASATESPSPAHLDALRHVGCYIKATSNYGISFSSRSNAALEAFIQFPLDDNNPTKPSPTAFTNSNWGRQDASTPTPQNYHQVSMDET